MTGRSRRTSPGRRSHAAARYALCLIAVAGLASCGGGSDRPTTPTAPTTPPVTSTPLLLACPTPVALRTAAGQSVPLAYELPRASGGVGTATITCSPTISTPVSAGQTLVSCSARDTAGTTATCSFPVVVTAAPVLAAERFLAIGNSFTFGTTSRAPMREIPGSNYTQKLEYLLRERYLNGRITVTNSGVPGNYIDQIYARYPSAVRETNAQVVIIEGGANDLIAEGARGIPYVVDKLERMTRDLQGRGVAVILTTLTPQRPPKGADPEAVRQFNVAVRDLCRRYQAGCADLHDAFGSESSPLIGSDGLHPTLAGYDLIAETYAAVIQRLYERPAQVPVS